MRVPLLTTLGLAAGCSFTPGTFGTTDDSGMTGETGDARRADGMASDTPACTAWTVMPTGVDPCAVATPTSGIQLCTAGTYTLSTTDGVLMGATSPPTTLLMDPDPDVRVIAVTELTVCSGVTLRITGAYPVVFLVYGSANIVGTIDVSAWRDDDEIWHAGPGAETACTSGIGPAGPADDGGAGGGAGGGFGGAGGNGGSGDELAPVVGGMAEGSPSLSPLRGGCRGGQGGDGDNGGSGGRAGRGGGAIQIAARNSMAVMGTIRASGGGGGGGTGTDGGGGGGGAGGAILLEAAMLATSGSLCANGGGGGGGANDGDSFDAGDPGAIGTCANSAAAAGGGGSDGGSSGGRGGFGTTDPQNGSGDDEGAGGGGGAVGRIHLRYAGTPVIGGTITPPQM